MRKRLWRITGACLAISLPVAFWLLPAGREATPLFAAPQQERVWRADPKHAAEFRDLALRQARVWQPTDTASFELGANPPDPTGSLSGSPVRCRYISEPVHGTTPKFNCLLPTGEVVKVKYGAYTGEIHAEIAATRLLSALGFGADRMYLVPRLRCYGCLRAPFQTVWALDSVHARNAVVRTVPPDSYTDFEWVAVERRFDGAAIEVQDDGGWPWFELEPLDPSRGASRAERDALRLAAMLLAHWDNKAANQRLVCQAAESDGAAPCSKPFALIHDLGATFGPNKVDLEAWNAVPIWADRRRCLVSMKTFPYDGGTFRDSTISEAGRQLIARQLAALTDRQMVALFTGARFPEFVGHGRGSDANTWAEALRNKIRQITDGAPCPISDE